ncbi:thiopurine S-methyltransferase [Pseudomonas wadenswilerensis]|jgi:thiopurine S-methyltransferase|uniref:Thiopurine S-methyltransferase n=1 Tax=Pseudomonas wadenswilerensis TaxID=1785161 RepID=A0A380SW55_9PSED|nr:MULTISPECIES: thiopurine S-methyltransferase [Pseudomonas]MCE5981420.1 thiopurine S-methyltransferase [Pseudomonas sp. LF19]SPO65819.1 Thiopurine S-methyltransferase [Pseudomonas sp. JV241A]SUQ62232.1 Thiopurine S-methyltransferase [Pseudomonas wadenswilerensis]
MQAEFWHKRWADNQIGFHQGRVNSYLQQFWPTLGLAPGSKVLVPLCGKSLDLAWLAGQGHQVLGVELSQRAVEDFFSEQQLQPEVGQRGAFKTYRSGPLEVWCGDFFALQVEDIADCSALYDRAAVIALPPASRERYAALLTGYLSQDCQGLLITMDYDQALLEGPPFAVVDAEVRQLFAGWQPQALEARDILAESPKFVQAGVPLLFERVYRLQR